MGIGGESSVCDKFSDEAGYENDGDYWEGAYNEFCFEEKENVPVKECCVGDDGEGAEKDFCD